MTKTPERASEQGAARQPGRESILPLAIRQRLWDQLWTRLLAPPIDPADKAPSPPTHDGQDGGQR
jgi:hypothetical protein